MWLTPEVPADVRVENHQEMRRRYVRQWESDNRQKRNKYWREYYARNRNARRKYLNEKQRQYRAERNSLGRTDSGSREANDSAAKDIGVVRSNQAL
jgi:hypothetical protein